MTLLQETLDPWLEELRRADYDAGLSGSLRQRPGRLPGGAAKTTGDAPTTNVRLAALRAWLPADIPISGWGHSDKLN